MIWFGKSLRPVAITATYFKASSGLISGSGFDIAKTIGSLAITFKSCWLITLGAETPRNTSASAITCLRVPSSLFGLVFSTNHCLLEFRSFRLALIAPLLSQPTRFFTPSCRIILEHAVPAAPTPETTTFISSAFLPTNFKALTKAAVETTAVPC